MSWGKEEEKESGKRTGEPSESIPASKRAVDQAVRVHSKTIVRQSIGAASFRLVLERVNLPARGCPWGGSLIGKTGEELTR